MKQYKIINIIIKYYIQVKLVLYYIFSLDAVIIHLPIPLKFSGDCSSK